MSYRFDRMYFLLGMPFYLESINDLWLREWSISYIQNFD